MKKVNYALFIYFLILLACLTLENYPKSFFQDSGEGLPAPMAMFFSAGWMCFFWEYICTLWQALHRRTY